MVRKCNQPIRYQIHKKTKRNKQNKNPQQVRQNEATDEHIPNEGTRYNPELSEVEIGNLLEKDFKIMIIKMIRELRRRTDEQSEKLEVFNKEIENIKDNQR